MESRLFITYENDFPDNISGGEVYMSADDKKPGKIYCSTFRGHRDSIIKRLVKSYANKEKYKISTQTPWHGWNPFARSMLVDAFECITFL